MSSGDYTQVVGSGRQMLLPTDPSCQSIFFGWHVIVLVIYSLGFPDIDRNRNYINGKIESILRKHVKQKTVEGRGENVLEGLSEKSLPLCQATQCLKKNKWKGEK